jgi:hypothetical protein
MPQCAPTEHKYKKIGFGKMKMFSEDFIVDFTYDNENNPCASQLFRAQMIVECIISNSFIYFIQ